MDKKVLVFLLVLLAVGSYLVVEYGDNFANTDPLFVSSSPPLVAPAMATTSPIRIRLEEAYKTAAAELDGKYKKEIAKTAEEKKAKEQAAMEAATVEAYQIYGDPYKEVNDALENTPTSKAFWHPEAFMSNSDPTWEEMMAQSDQDEANRKRATEEAYRLYSTSYSSYEAKK
ncbi:MAG: hypothetical protein WCT37_02460 [Patescibacteria group bacterium]|jgi:hypothetical protein